MRILCDVDGVCANFVDYFLYLAQIVTGRSFNHEDVTDYDLEKCLKLTGSEYSRIKELMFEPGGIRALASISGVYEGIAAIEKMGHTVIFTTSPWVKHPTWAHEREQWIHERWPDRAIISTKEKHCIAGDVLIEDKPSTIAKWQDDIRKGWHTGLGLGLLFDQPWNKGRMEGSLAVRRCFDWDDVVREIKEITHD